MAQTRSNDFISNLKIDHDGYTVHVKYTRNSDGKDMDNRLILAFNGYDLESCKNLIKDLEDLKQEQYRNRELNMSESRGQKFDRYVNETKAIDQLLDNYKIVNSTLPKGARMEKVLDHAEFLVTNYTVMSEFRKAKQEAYKYCDPSIQRTSPSKEDMNRLTQADLIDLLQKKEHLESRLLSLP